MPKNPEERKKWLERIGLNNEDIPENAKLCLLHFEESAFDRRDDYYIRIRPGVIPFGNASVSNIEAPKKETESTGHKKSRKYCSQDNCTR
ncbi:unnamed protein product [Lasius platythorax]|uniref:THAP-type domain-containing protein n=1 Tax=Lasius platythorax TaxID=488582 RepID=A0AAV2MZA7_9HYME